MTTFSMVYQGDLRCLAKHAASGVELITDAPVDNHGRGQSFSPTDLVATGLGVCMATIMGIVAKRDGIALEGAAARIEKHMSSTQPRKIVKIAVAFAMPKGIAMQRRQVLEAAAHSCPVALSLHPEIQQDVSFTYPD